MIMISTPTQIHITSGFRWALMIGRPVSRFALVDYVQILFERASEFAAMVCGCWLAL